MSISNWLSSDVAVAILTKRKELNRDPSELLNIVLAVHVTLQELSAKAHDSRHVFGTGFYGPTRAVINLQHSFQT